MATTFFIPKLDDRAVIASLGKVRATMTPRPLNLSITPVRGAEIKLNAVDPENEPSIKWLLDENGEVISTFQLVDHATGHLALIVRRRYEQPTDSVEISDNWMNVGVDPAARVLLDQAYVRLVGLARKELSASDLDAALKGFGDSAWNRYRESQMTILNSLQGTVELLLVKSADQKIAADLAREEKFSKIETDLRAAIEAQRKTLDLEFVQKLDALREREKTLQENQAAFNTKEAGYVGRMKQQEQIEQLKKWLEGWSLTTGTSTKRRPIFWAYMVALVISGAFTITAVVWSYLLLDGTEVIAHLNAWQWAVISLKSLLPFGAFTSFLVYFIRWEGSWARQHADEEFLTRTRLIDIGRSSWLLEAVRDAGETDKVIPVELLKELSHNLFENRLPTDTDVHPQALSDFVMQGLSSFRVKTPDGSEFEAKTKKG